jgi:hypothetical protein
MVQCFNGLSELTSFMDIRDDICLLLSERETALGRHTDSVGDDRS